MSLVSRSHNQNLLVHSRANVIAVDASKVIRHVYPDKYGVHRCATFGDFRERLKDVATLIGFKTIEEDA